MQLSWVYLHNDAYFHNGSLSLNFNDSGPLQSCLLSKLLLNVVFRKDD